MQKVLPLSHISSRAAAFKSTAATQNLEAALQPHTWKAAASQLAATLPGSGTFPCPMSASAALGQLQSAHHTVAMNSSSSNQPRADSLQLLGVQHSCCTALLHIMCSLDLATILGQEHQQASSLVQSVAALQSLHLDPARLTVWPFVSTTRQPPTAITQQQNSMASVRDAQRMLKGASVQMAEAALGHPGGVMLACIQTDMAMVAAWSATAPQKPAQAPTQDSDEGSPTQLRQQPVDPVGTDTDASGVSESQHTAVMLEHSVSLLRSLVAATQHAVVQAVQERLRGCGKPEKIQEALDILHLGLDLTEVRQWMSCVCTALASCSSPYVMWAPALS